MSLTFPVLLGVTPALRTRAISIPISCSMRKIAKSLKSAYAWSRSLSCRIVLKLHFQLFNNVDIFSQWVAISQEDMSKLDMWVEFVVGSCRCSESFLWVLRFSSLHKNKHS